MDSRRDIVSERFPCGEPMLATVVRATGPPATPATTTPSPWSAQGATTDWFVPQPPPADLAGPPAPPETPATRGRGWRALTAAAGAAALATAVTISVLLVPGGRTAETQDPPSQLVARAAGPWVNRYTLAGSRADYQLTIDGARWHLTGADYVMVGNHRNGIRQSCSGTVTADAYQLTFTTKTGTAEPIGSGLPGRQAGGSFCAGVFNAVLYPAGQTLDLIDPRSVRTYQMRRP